MRLKSIALLISLAVSSFTAAAATEERLVSLPYPGNAPWQEVTNETQGKGWLRVQIPAGQKIETHRDILTLQAFPDHRETSPSIFLRSFFSRVKGSCEIVRFEGPEERMEGGRPVAYAQVYCDRQKGMDFGLNMFFKVIGGGDALYVMQRGFKVTPTGTAGLVGTATDPRLRPAPLSDGEIAARHYLDRSVYLCGGLSTDERCSTRP